MSEYFIVIKDGIVWDENMPEYTLIDLDNLKYGICPVCGGATANIEGDCREIKCDWNTKQFKQWREL